MMLLLVWWRFDVLNEVKLYPIRLDSVPTNKFYISKVVKPWHGMHTMHWGNLWTTLIAGIPGMLITTTKHVNNNNTTPVKLNSEQGIKKNRDVNSVFFINFVQI